MTEMKTLPTLTGSPKQIAWAEKIITQAAARPGSAMQKRLCGIRAFRGLTIDECDNAFAWLGRRLLDGALARHTDAAWWIDNRSNVIDAAYGELRGPERIATLAALAEHIAGQRAAA